MHPALRKGPLFYKKTPFPIFHFLQKNTHPIFHFFLQNTPIFHFFYKTPPISFPAYGPVCIQLPTSVVNVTLLAVAAVRRSLLQYRLPAGPTAANPPHVAAADETHRRKDTVPLHRPRPILCE